MIKELMKQTIFLNLFSASNGINGHFLEVLREAAVIVVLPPREKPKISHFSSPTLSKKELFIIFESLFQKNVDDKKNANTKSFLKYSRDISGCLFLLLF